MERERERWREGEEMMKSVGDGLSCFSVNFILKKSYSFIRHKQKLNKISAAPSGPFGFLSVPLIPGQTRFISQVPNIIHNALFPPGNLFSMCNIVAKRPEL